MRKSIGKISSTLALTSMCLFGAGMAAAESEMSLAKAAQKTNNPVSDAWLMIVQNDYTVIEGDATGGASEMQERLSFQPVMPIPIFDGEWNLVNRVVVQAFSSPIDKDFDFDRDANPATQPSLYGDRTTGMGDTIAFSLFAPNRDDGFIWGVGPSFILPTATEDVLGQEKWQAGAAALAVRLGNSHGGLGIESWNIGVLAQHWWDVDGNDDREDTNQSDIQYFINWKKDPINLIGMTPNIQINWEKEGSDRFTVPIGIGKIGFMRWGKVPVRWGIELQHYVMQPDPVGPEWNLKFFLAPVMANPFKS